MIARFSPDAGRQALQDTPAEFAELFTHGSLVVEFYKPEGIDRQQPHDRDEVYVVLSGTGTFFCAGDMTAFSPGDLLFVPAGAEHRFENFTHDFAAWVLFYGPVGGEKTSEPEGLQGL